MAEEEKPVLPPPEIMNDPAIEVTSISDLVERDPLTLTDQDIRQIIQALRAQRRNFAQLEAEKGKGNVSKKAKKLPAERLAILAKLNIDDLDLNI